MPFTYTASGLAGTAPTGVYLASPPRRHRRRKPSGTGGTARIIRPAVVPLLTVTYDPTLARVRINATAVYVGGRVELLRYDTPLLVNGQAVRGGSVDPMDVQDLRVDDYEFTDGVLNTYQLRVYDGADTLLYTLTAAVTPALGGIWLKNLGRPYLNRQVTVTGFGDVAAPARGGVIDVIGRRNSVAITDVRGPRRYDLVLRAADLDEADTLDLALSFGDPVFVHVPAGCLVPRSMHAFVGDVTSTRPPRHDSTARYFTLPLTEVDAPDGSIIGTTVTCAGILAAFPTCAAVLAAFPTVLDMLDYVSAPSDEVVG